MVVGLCHRTVDVSEHVPRRDDVEQCHSGDHLGPVQAHTLCDPDTAVVANDREGLEAKVPHERDLISGHGALGVRGVIELRRWPGRVAVPTQVGKDDRVPVSQFRRHPVPHHMTLRVAVQQQNRRPVAAHGGVDARLVDVDVRAFKALELGSCLPLPGRTNPHSGPPVPQRRCLAPSLRRTREGHRPGTAPALAPGRRSQDRREILSLVSRYRGDKTHFGDGWIATDPGERGRLRHAA